MRVFVSSTVYDLIDVRSEIEEHLRSLGLTPVLSDSPTSAFDASSQTNSIETCLVQLRSCDKVIVILSNRYGPVLGRAGFQNISATHLEYREAIECKKPLVFYVRDRLEADYRHWRGLDKEQRPSAEFQWVSRSQDFPLFDFLHEHQTLQNQNDKSNWFSAFRDIRELKQLVSRDFRAEAFRGQLDRILSEGRLPASQLYLETTRGNRERLHLTVFLTNAGNQAMCNVRVDGRSASKTLFADNTAWLAPNASWQSEVSTFSDLKRDELKSITVTYELPVGHRGRDHFEVTTFDDPSKSVGREGGVVLRANLLEREFSPRPTDSPGFKIISPEEFDQPA